MNSFDSFQTIVAMSLSIRVLNERQKHVFQVDLSFANFFNFAAGGYEHRNQRRHVAPWLELQSEPPILLRHRSDVWAAAEQRQDGLTEPASRNLHATCSRLRAKLRGRPL